jgi:hypothetical protein
MDDGPLGTQILGLVDEQGQIGMSSVRERFEATHSEEAMTAAIGALVQEEQLVARVPGAVGDDQRWARPERN